MPNVDRWITWTLEERCCICCDVHVLFCWWHVYPLWYMMLQTCPFVEAFWHGVMLMGWWSWLLIGVDYMFGWYLWLDGYVILHEISVIIILSLIAFLVCIREKYILEYVGLTWVYRYTLNPRVPKLIVINQVHTHTHTPCYMCRHAKLETMAEKYTLALSDEAKCVAVI